MDEVNTGSEKKKAKGVTRAVRMRYRNKQSLHFREFLFL